MVICPKCNQPSQSDKICSNCWADLKSKPTKKSSRDLTKMPLKNIFILAVMVVAFGFFLAIMGKMMSPSGNDQNNTPVNNSK